jgi:predicted RND superfamily exporter protein
MMHSGVAITITSITDVVAFALSGTSNLPALRSFCLFASVGIVSIYFFVCTFFVAFMYLDQIRDQFFGTPFWPISGKSK